ncbi:hypothetical protein BDR05DRAFT_967595 [Suillus weaverae]|nr:hypothetical protein BDR05DRAFT_967595 [Suillus weaverae]
MHTSYTFCKARHLRGLYGCTAPGIAGFRWLILNIPYETSGATFVPSEGLDRGGPKNGFAGRGEEQCRRG